MYDWNRCLQSLGTIGIFTLLTGCYVVKQAWYQNNLLNSRVKISQVLNDVEDPAIREGLELVQDLLKFGGEQGLNTENAYQYYVPVERRAVSFIVQAALPDQMVSKTWWFPFVGRVPYLGYFDRNDRDAMAKGLRREGFDVSQGEISAFSSLGWFEDPIYTPMLKRTKVSLAHLIFHELIHRTYWSGSSTMFNENLAEFLAEHLTVRYLESKNQKRSAESYLNYRKDREKFRLWLKDLKEALIVLYAQSRPRDDAFYQEKDEIILTYQREKVPDFRSKHFYEVIKKKWNNASILGSSLYLPDVEIFQRALVCYGADKSIGNFLRQLEVFENEVDDVVIGLSSFCRERKG